MNNALEISEEIRRIEKSVKNIKELLKWDNELPEDEQEKIIAHLHHLVRQKNEIKKVLSPK